MDGLTSLFTADGVGSPSTPSTSAAQGALNDPTAVGVGKDILQQVKGMKTGQHGEEREVLLILDQPDLLLAATEDDIGHIRMMSMVMDLREVNVNPPHARFCLTHTIPIETVLTPVQYPACPFNDSYPRSRFAPYTATNYTARVPA